MSALINNVTEIASPLMSVWMTRKSSSHTSNAKSKVPSNTTSTVSSDPHVTASIASNDRHSQKDYLDELLVKELARPSYNLDDDYLEMVLLISIYNMILF